MKTSKYYEDVVVLEPVCLLERVQCGASSVRKGLPWHLLLESCQHMAGPGAEAITL